MIRKHVRKLAAVILAAGAITASGICPAEPGIRVLSGEMGNTPG